MLSDDILLSIFQIYMDATPQRWPILTYVCRRWQQLISSSPAGLRLRLYCTHGTPVLRILDYSPSFPFIINYGGPPMLNPPAPEDDDNIIAVLKQSDRVNSISLTLTTSLLGKLSTISEPLSELEELVLLSQDKLQLTLPSAFRWGIRLRTLHVTRITIPSLPPLLSSSTDLVDLQLHEIPVTGYFSPHWQAFADALSGASHLRSLSLHFLSCPPRRSYVGLPLSGHRVVLPALKSFKYRGTSKYLDIFVARIDAPHLADINVTFFSQPTMDASQLGQFIERIGLNTALSEAAIQASARAISISFMSSSPSTRLELQITCKQLDWQLSSMVQVCDQFSPFLSNVQDLIFNMNDLSSGQDDVDNGQWLNLIRSFGATRTLSIAGEFTTRILCALRPAGERYTTDTTVLPALRSLRVRKLGPLDLPFWDAAQSLISQGLSGHPKELWYECPNCVHPGFTSRGLRDHLEKKHAYEYVCSYCNDFQFTSPYSFPFYNHLRSKHPKIVPSANKKFMPYGELIAQLNPLECNIHQYSFMRKPQTPPWAPSFKRRINKWSRAEADKRLRAGLSLVTPQPDYPKR